MNFNFLTFLLPVLAFVLPVSLGAAGHPPTPDQDFEKTFSETFSVNGSGDVRLTNRYGDIRVETWDRNEVKIDVRVKVSANDREDADRTFDRIEISFSGGANTATAITSISNGKTSSKGIIRSIIDGEWPSWSNSGGSNDFKVHYTVKMPASTSLETDAKYCDVMLPDLSGNTRLTVGYGDLVAGDLTGSNEISVSYGSARIDELGENSSFRVRYCDGNTIRRAADLRYDGRYSETEIGTVDRLRVDAGYEDMEVRQAREIRFDGNYNDLVVERVERIFLDGNYSDVEINEVTKELEVDASYGDLEIDELAAGFERVYIRVNYIDVDLDIDDDAGYELDLRTRYGSIDFSGRNATFDRDKSGSSQSLTGHKKGTGSGRVDISTSYGDIDIH
ncbi:DUF4097 family beta strand repeat-containing protein [Neolewinella aurantiaca]|nr:DUF4097 family beta strand repeat-containing protein [Neolewinella aurantiaca]